MSLAFWVRIKDFQLPARIELTRRGVFTRRSGPYIFMVFRTRSPFLVLSVSPRSNKVDDSIKHMLRIIFDRVSSKACLEPLRLFWLAPVDGYCHGYAAGGMNLVTLPLRLLPWSWLMAGSPVSSVNWLLAAIGRRVMVASHFVWLPEPEWMVNAWPRSAGLGQRCREAAARLSSGQQALQLELIGQKFRHHHARRWIYAETNEWPRYDTGQQALVARGHGPAISRCGLREF